MDKAQILASAVSLRMSVGMGMQAWWSRSGCTCVCEELCGRHSGDVTPGESWRDGSGKSMDVPSGMFKRAQAPPLVPQELR